MVINIPDYVIEDLARSLLPAIREFYKSEENQKAFDEWQRSKKAKKENHNSPSLPRMRTVREAAEELKKMDASTAITEYHIRRLALDGVIPRVKAGKKYLINLDTLIDYLEGKK